MHVVILIRHPAAFVTSMMRLGSPHHLEDLTRQGVLMERHLGGILANVRVSNLPMVEQLALSWLCLYHVMTKYLAANPAMMLLKHEDLSNDPVNSVENLYRQFGLPFGPAIDRTICRYTAGSNPIEPTRNEPHVLKRDSRGNTTRWKSALTPSQALAIRSITLPVAQEHYSEDSWFIGGAETFVEGARMSQNEG
jgi:hypothetical protein